MQYRLVALDLDGTLLDRQGQIRPANMAALARAAARGVTVAIVTGRPVGSARDLARQLSRGIGAPVPFAACNGAVVFGADGRRIAARPIASGVLAQALALLEAEGALVECYGLEHVFIDRLRQHLSRWWDPGRPPLARAAGALRTAWYMIRTNRVRVVRSLPQWARQAREPVCKIFVVDLDEESSRRLADRLAAALPTLHITSSGPDNLEVGAPQAHKGWGLRMLAESLRIPREAILAIGDGLNDLEMLEYAGLGVAMGNGAPEVRARADWVAPGVEEDGVARAVERWILKEA
ncbi:MAG: Cof-type HAD-IIB family hydrolase [Firmicutes bacterium]|nr:Cof-type HAD-IIB family hydrolase [Bacillota bacterium]